MKLFAFSLLTFLFLCSCSGNNTLFPPSSVNDRTQLQIREFQTREFPAQDERLVLKAMLNVFQDDGFVIKNAVSDLGLITAEKELDVENKGDALFATLFFGDEARWSKNSLMEATVNITSRSNISRLRVTFRVKTFDNRGVFVSSETLEDPAYYQQFFSKVDKGLFLQRESL
jgi:hypothetical protein